VPLNSIKRLVFRRVHKVVKSDSWLGHVCLSVRQPARMEQFGSQSADFHEIWYEDFLKLCFGNETYIKI
jgi:hypothetical protein